MRKMIAYLSMSVDGFIATKNDEVSWLDEIVGEGDNGYMDIYHSVDTVILGYRTYKWIEENAIDYPYSDKQSIIISNRDFQLSNDNLTVYSSDIHAKLQALKEGVGKDIWIVGGGGLISDLINDGLLDELRITVAPRLLGDGIRLFNEIDGIKKLKHIATIQYGEFVELTYHIK